MRFVGVNYRILEFYHTQFIRGYCIGLLLLPFELLYILFHLLLTFSILSFCLFILFMGLSRQEYWSGLLFPSPVDHVLSENDDSQFLFCHLADLTAEIQLTSVNWSYILHLCWTHFLVFLLFNYFWTLHLIICIDKPVVCG